MIKTTEKTIDMVDMMDKQKELTDFIRKKKRITGPQIKKRYNGHHLRIMGNCERIEVRGIQILDQ